MNLAIDGLITSPTLENLIEKSLACKSIFVDTLVAYSSLGHTRFLNYVSVTLIDKMEGSNPKKGRLLNEDLKIHDSLRLKY